MFLFAAESNGRGRDTENLPLEEAIDQQGKLFYRKKEYLSVTNAGSPPLC